MGNADLNLESKQETSYTLPVLKYMKFMTIISLVQTSYIEEQRKYYLFAFPCLSTSS